MHSQGTGCVHAFMLAWSGLGCVRLVWCWDSMYHGHCVHVVQAGPGDVSLQGTLQTDRPVQALDVVGDGHERLLAVACDKQVLTLAL